MQLSRLATLRKDVEGVSVNFDRALDLVSASGAGNADGRLAELSQFVEATQARLDEIERNMATFGQLRRGSTTCNPASSRSNPATAASRI